MRRLLVILALGFSLGLPALAVAEPEQPRTHEILSNRPSGFWTSNAPAENGAYRWRLLGIGVVLAAGSGLVMWRLLKRANAHRRAHPNPAEPPQLS